jgi:phytanoyl-CoA hydroxylase
MGSLTTLQWEMHNSNTWLNRIYNTSALISTQNKMEDFWLNGYMKVKQFLTEEEVKKVLVELQSIDTSRMDEGHVFRMTTEDRDDVKQLQYLFMYSDYIRDMIKPKLVSFVHNTFQNDKYEVVNMQMFAKPPLSKGTDAHQDGFYFGRKRYDEYNKNPITCWIALNDVDESRGCMYYVPHSHRLGLLDHCLFGSTVRTRTGVTGLAAYVDYTHISKQEIPMIIKAGDMIIHDSLLVHRSSPNTIQNHTRRALSTIMIPTDCSRADMLSE